ncbi:hypothetical protein BLNAU_22390 [Blattamonas nauphoetae]|uniref:Uncharacterized protein n=1 Tax=Blattamonas nauphoetae TaxID=2049346 RepID=A0ABQ9WTP5_9EUKA|nr:hypothetical protein BLNAU_22390 [Blattamonas nauphoetae]
MLPDISFTHSSTPLPSTQQPNEEKTFLVFHEAIEKLGESDDDSRFRTLQTIRGILEEGDLGVNRTSELAIRYGITETLGKLLHEKCSLRIRVLIRGLLMMIATGATRNEIKGHSQMIIPLLCLGDHPDKEVSEHAMRTVGILCRGGMDTPEVAGIVNGGVIERICSAAMSGENWRRISIVRVLGFLTVGLRRWVWENEKEGEKKEEPPKDEETTSDLQTLPANIEFFLLNRVKAGLRMIQQTLSSLLGELRGMVDEGEVLDDGGYEELHVLVAGLLGRHFGGVELEPNQTVGTIGLDVGRELARMAEEYSERRRKLEEEMKAAEEEKGRMEEMMRQMEETIREKERKWVREKEELNTQLKQLSNTNKQTKARLEKRMDTMDDLESEFEEETDCDRMEEEGVEGVSREGEAAIEIIDDDKHKGSLPLSVTVSSRTIFSFVFSGCVVQFVFRITSIEDSVEVGVVSDTFVRGSRSGYLSNQKGACGFDLCDHTLYVGQNSKQSGSLSMGGSVGDVIVLEADGRRWKRSLKLSINGAVEDLFFVNIPLRFRFAVHSWDGSDIVEMIGTRVLPEPLLVGGSRAIRMDE